MIDDQSFDLSVSRRFVFSLFFVCLLYKHKESREKKRDTEVYYHRKKESKRRFMANEFVLGT